MLVDPTTGLARADFWWIHTFTIRQGSAYPFRVAGFNDHAQTLNSLGREPHSFTDFAWRVPSVARGYAFTLHEVPMDSNGFDFEAWRAANARTREARRAELAAALGASGRVRETLGGGDVITWWLDGDGFPVTHHARSGNQDRAFISPWTPERLAEHLENREFGFGFALTIEGTR